MKATESRRKPRRRFGRSAPHGFSMIELLVAVMLLAIAATGAAGTWVFSLRATANKRLTEMGAYIGIQELERMKDLRYDALTYTQESAPVVDWYDKNGQWLGTAPSVTGGVYRASTWIRPIVDRDATANQEDLKEIEVQVWSGDGSAQYEGVRTLITYGGI